MPYRSILPMKHNHKIIYAFFAEKSSFSRNRAARIRERKSCILPRPERRRRRRLVVPSRFCVFFTSFRIKTPKSISFFDFFSIFRFFFLNLELSLGTGFLPFGRNVHISRLDFAVKTRLRFRKKRRPKRPPLRGLTGNMTWSLDKSRLEADRDASSAIRRRRCRV